MKKSIRLICLLISAILILDLCYIPAKAQESGTTQEDSTEGENNNDVEGQNLEEEPVDEPEEEPVDEPEENPVDEPEEEPVDEPKEEPVDEPEENPVDKLSEDKEYITDLKVESATDEVIKLSWTITDPEFDGYSIKIYSDKDKVNQVGESISVEDADQIDYEIDRAELGLEYGKIYYVSVTPYKLVEVTPEEASEEAEKKPIEFLSVSRAITFLSTPTISSIKAGDTQVVLAWGVVDGATAYEVYCMNTKSVVGVVKSTTYTHKNLINNKQYTYKINAVTEIEAINFKSDWSKARTSAKTMTVKPGKVTQISIDGVNKGAIISWTAPKGATSYYVYRYNSSKKRWDRIAHTTATSYTNTGLKTGKTFQYRVRAIRTSGGVTVQAADSAKVKLKIKSYLTGSVRPMYFKGRILRKTKAYSSKSSKKVVKYLKKGTKVTILSQGKKLQVKLSNGKKYWISRNNVKFLSCLYTTKDYTTNDKEAFVNKKGYSSKTPYLIWISAYTQKVNIYKGSKGKWKLIRTCKVATGTHNNPTVKGTFKITYREKGWYYTNTCVKKIVHFAGRNSFHSRIYRYNGKLSDSRIGKPASHGCVRMYMEDINYIYNKMPIGTTVVSY